jgi:hypothetical protein
MYRIIIHVVFEGVGTLTGLDLFGQYISDEGSIVSSGFDR